MELAPGSKRRRAADEPELERQLEPGWAILQFRRLFGRQLTLRHIDGFPTKRADFGRCCCLRSDGRLNAFSAIGYQGATCGAGDTEDCRLSTAVKYRVDIGKFRVAAFWQFGGYDLNNAATGSYQFQIGGDIANLAGGTLSLDAIGGYIQNAVPMGLAGNTLPGSAAAGSHCDAFRQHGRDAACQIQQRAAQSCSRDTNTFYMHPRAILSEPALDSMISPEISSAQAARRSTTRTSTARLSMPATRPSMYFGPG